MKYYDSYTPPSFFVGCVCWMCLCVSNLINVKMVEPGHKGIESLPQTQFFLSLYFFQSDGVNH